MATTLNKDFAFPSNAALFLDFDGTLVGFRDNPYSVHLANSEISCLLNLNDKLDGALAIISGRDIVDLSKRVPIALWRIGNHGLYSAAPNTPPPNDLPKFSSDIRRKIDKVMSQVPEIWIEDKGPVLAIHHRKKPALGLAISQAISPLLAPLKTHIIQVGNCVVEIKPASANKGIGLRKQMTRDPFLGRMPIMIGDDTTDEEGFIAAKKLGGFGIKIGHGPTQAKYNLLNIQDLYSFLRLPT